jgi:hypothetical protein
MKPVFTVLLATVLFISPSFSQTDLTAGGIALLGANCDNPDDFAFLLLVDIEAGTVIKFTDNGWLAAGGFRAGEGIQTYTAPAAIDAGTVIVFSQHPDDFSVSGSFALASTGDQLLVYQGEDITPVMIYALNIAGDGVWQSDASSTNTSALPSGLVDGETAVAVQEFDNVKFGGLTQFSTPLVALLAIGDNTNWLGDDVNRFDLSSFGDFSLPVQLSSFTARAGDGIVTLQWITESEKDNAGFEILRAVAGDSSYILLSSYIHNPALRGQLNTNSRTIYKFEDRLVANDVSYWYQLVDVEVNGEKTFHGPVTATPHAAGGEVTNSGIANLPESFVLHPNFPNPFNPKTTLRFDIPQLSSNLAEVSLVVYNVVGQRVKVLFQGQLPAGHYSSDWEGTDEEEMVMPAGNYYAVLRAGYLTRAVQMIYLK